MCCTGGCKLTEKRWRRKMESDRLCMYNDCMPERCWKPYRCYLCQVQISSQHYVRHSLAFHSIQFTEIFQLNSRNSIYFTDSRTYTETIVPNVIILFCVICAINWYADERRAHRTCSLRPIFAHPIHWRLQFALLFLQRFFQTGSIHCSFWFFLIFWLCSEPSVYHRGGDIWNSDLNALARL